MGSHHFGVQNFEFQYRWGFSEKWLFFGVWRFCGYLFGSSQNIKKLTPKMVRAYVCMKISEYPPPLSHPGASMLGIREQYQRTSYFVFGVTTQIAKIRWAHVGSWWKCGRRRIPTLYQHRTNATMSTILSLLNTTILLQNPLCLYSE